MQGVAYLNNNQLDRRERGLSLTLGKEERNDLGLKFSRVRVVLGDERCEVKCFGKWVR